MSVSFAIACKASFAQEMPIYTCSKDQAVALRGEVINCNAFRDVVDALQRQFDFSVTQRLRGSEDICGGVYVYALKALEEDKPALRKKAPELLDKCSRAILADKK